MHVVRVIVVAYLKDVQQEGANECKGLSNVNILAMSSKTLSRLTIITI